MVHSIELKFDMYIIGHCRTNPIDFGECRTCSFFYRSTKKISYTLRPLESKSLKDSSIQTVHSIELKFVMYITDHYRTNITDFGEFQGHSFFLQGYKKEFLYITAYGVKFFKRF